MARGTPICNKHRTLVLRVALRTQVRPAFAKCLIFVMTSKVASHFISRLLLFIYLFLKQSHSRMHVRHCGTPTLWGRSLTVTVNSWWEFIMKPVWTPVCCAPPPAAGTGSLTPRQLVDEEKRGKNYLWNGFVLRVSIPAGRSVGISPTSCHGCNVMGSPKHVLGCRKP